MSVGETWISVRVNAVSESNFERHFFISIYIQKVTDRPGLYGMPNANDLNDDLMMQQTPQDLNSQSVESLKPRSQMHWEPWNVLISSNDGFLDLDAQVYVSLMIMRSLRASPVEIVSSTSVPSGNNFVCLLERWRFIRRLPFAQELRPH